MLRAIESDNFPPFGKFRLTLPPVEQKPDNLAEVQLFTGVNGTGKTRLLSVLAAMLGNDEPLLKRVKGLENLFFVSASGILPVLGKQLQGLSSFCVQAGKVGWEHYSSPLNTWIDGPAFAYSGMAYISDSAIFAMAEVAKPSRQQCLSFIRTEGSSQPLLQAITNLIFQSAMDSMNVSTMGGISRSARIIGAIETTLSDVTGFKFNFKVTSYPNVSIGVFWGNRSLPFNLLPDGLRSIIGWLVHAVVMTDTWLQGKGDPMETEAVFLLDEIESHLHPAWQRKILPAFQRLCPKSQIFIATHSPFLIASLNHGWIHQLTMETDGSVTIQEPKAASAGDSYISVVEDIMGVKEWYDPESEMLLAEFRELRDLAYRGDTSAQGKARSKAAEIGKRSMELDYLMGKELKQMDHQLSKTNGKHEEVHQA